MVRHHPRRRKIRQQAYTYSRTICFRDRVIPGKLLTAVPASHAVDGVSPSTSKQTLTLSAKSLLKTLQNNKETALKNYVFDGIDRQYNIWQRDPLAIQLFNSETTAQKLNYIHLNPLQPHWLLCSKPVEYRFSTAIFYEQQIDELSYLLILVQYSNLWMVRHHPRRGV